MAALYGDEVRGGTCALGEEDARARALALFPAATVLEVERSDIGDIAVLEVELETENGREAEVELFVASCGLYEAESDDAEVDFDGSEFVAITLAEAIDEARPFLNPADARVEDWELRRDEETGSEWVFEIAFEEGTDVTVAATGVVSVDRDEDADEYVDGDADEHVDEDADDDADEYVDEDADEYVDEDADDDADEHTDEDDAAYEAGDDSAS